MPGSHRRGMRIDLLSAAGLALLASLCAGADAQSAPSRVPAECPDFSGIYGYPGVDRESDVCTLLTDSTFGAGLPVPATSGYLSIRAEAEIEIRQEGCQRIGFYAPFAIDYLDRYRDQVLEDLRRSGTRYRVLPDGGALPGYFRVDKWGTVEVDLIPGARREVRWSEDSLYLRYRFRAEGFGAGWGRHFFTLRLTKLPSGALQYELRHDQTGPGDAAIACTLQPADGQAPGR